MGGLEISLDPLTRLFVQRAHVQLQEVVKLDHFLSLVLVVMVGHKVHHLEELSVLLINSHSLHLLEAPALRPVHHAGVAIGVVEEGGEGVCRLIKHHRLVITWVDRLHVLNYLHSKVFKSDAVVLFLS